MRNVVSINKGKFLGYYSEAQNSEWIPDEAYFFTGVLFSLALPQIICSVYGGIIPLLAFATSTLAGVIVGVTIYLQFPHRVTSCVSTRIVPEAPLSEAVKPKAA